jgi:hypothetical protein
VELFYRQPMLPVETLCCMMRLVAVVVDYCRRLVVGEPALRSDDYLAWRFERELPADTRRGDVGVMFAGGRRQCYIGWETIESDWQISRGGIDRGERYVRATWHFLHRPLPGAAAAEALGIRSPRSALSCRNQRVPDSLLSCANHELLTRMLLKASSPNRDGTVEAEAQSFADRSSRRRTGYAKRAELTIRG